MKGYAAAAPPAKRRWSCLGATVLVLVFGSLLVPLGFLLGGFPSGYLTDERPSREPGFDSRDQWVIVDREEKSIEGDDDGMKIEDLLNKFAPPIPKAVTEDNFPEAKEDKETQSNPTNASVHVTLEPKNATSHLKLKDSASHSNGSPAAQTIAPKSPSSLNTRGGAKAARGKGARRFTADESGRSCQLEFGSYCLWSIEHKAVLRDPMVKRLKDQLFVARAYYPSIAKLQGQEKLTSELKQHIQEHEKMLSEAISDADLPSLYPVSSSGASNTMSLSGSQAATSSADGRPPTKYKRLSGTKDTCWNYGEFVFEGDNQLVKCIFCEVVYKAGINRIKHHIASTSSDVKTCSKATDEARALCRVVEKKHAQEKSRMIYEESEEGSINVENEEDQDEETTIATGSKRGHLIGSLIMSLRIQKR